VGSVGKTHRPPRKEILMSESNVFDKFNISTESNNVGNDGLAIPKHTQNILEGNMQERITLQDIMRKFKKKSRSFEHKLDELESLVKELIDEINYTHNSINLFAQRQREFENKMSQTNMYFMMMSMMNPQNNMDYYEEAKPRFPKRSGRNRPVNTRFIDQW
jgi:hypothetical protein